MKNTATTIDSQPFNRARTGAKRQRYLDLCVGENSSEMSFASPLRLHTEAAAKMQRFPDQNLRNCDGSSVNKFIFIDLQVLSQSRHTVSQPKSSKLRPKNITKATEFKP
jgi:hypothetical protein